MVTSEDLNKSFKKLILNDLPIKEVNRRIKELQNSFIWNLIPGTEVLQVTEGVTVPCSEVVNGILYTSKVETVKEKVIYLGFSIIDENDIIKENYIDGRFYKQKRLTFGEYFTKVAGLVSKEYTYGFYKPKRYITKSEQYINTCYEMNINYQGRGVYLSQVEKDKVYFNYSLSARGPFHNAWIELIK